MRLVLGISTVLGIVGVIAAFGSLLSGGACVSSGPRPHPDAHVSEALRSRSSDDLPDADARAILVDTPGENSVDRSPEYASYRDSDRRLRFFMHPLGWGWAGFVWAYAIAWALLNDRVKLLAYRILIRPKPLLPGKPTQDRKPTPQDLKPEIETRAYELFEKHGRTDGQADGGLGRSGARDRERTPIATK